MKHSYFVPFNDKHRDGFTLVEMLVSVTLVLLMMSMFAQIFSVATSSVTKQRVISEKDQKARSISTVIRADIAKRTFTYPLPFYPGEDSATSPTQFGSRAGYIYLNTNDPSSFSDDFLQLTVNSRLQTENQDTEEFYGKALPLADRVTGVASLPQNPNQPDVDGGSLLPDSSSSSPAAQIAYFVRNGNLYRRVVLIRNPIDIAGRELDSQPTSNQSNDLFAGIAGDGMFQAFDGTLSNDFPRHFDFSASVNAPGTPAQSAQFLGLECLSNELTTAGAAAQTFGNPQFRYGFNQATGISREFDDAASSRRFFIGRFTQAETSASCFNWPQRLSKVELSYSAQGSPDSAMILGNGNPFDITGCPVSLNLTTGLVNEFNGKDDTNDPAAIEGRGGPRQMEDLLLANVQEMRLELWDDRLNRFIAPGYGTLVPRSGSAITDPDSLVGDFHIRRNLQFDATNQRFWSGPLAPYNPATPRESDRQPHVFDTWHPAVAINFDGAAGIALHESLPPYISYKMSPPRRPIGPSSAAMPDDFPGGSPATVNKSYWAPATPYVVGDVVFTQWIDGSGTNPIPDGLFAFDEIAEPKFAIAYRCIEAGTSGGTTPSVSAPGQRIQEGVPGDPVIWESFDNRVPLKAIRMTIRFTNETTGDPRHMTFVLPMGE